MCNVGVWGVSRHPNYFGEVLIWWGAFTVAVRPIQDKNDYEALWTILSPLFTMFLLLFVSGIPLAEGQKLKRFMRTAESRQNFMEYFNSVPPLVPCVPAVYQCFPSWAKCLFCCEFPMYAYNDEEEALNSKAGAQRDNIADAKAEA